MIKDARLSIRLESKLKDEVDRIFAELGISASEAIAMFYNQIRIRKGLPFEVVIPQEENREARRQAETGEGLKTYDDVDEMFEDAKTW